MRDGRSHRSADTLRRFDTRAERLSYGGAPLLSKDVARGSREAPSKLLNQPARAGRVVAPAFVKGARFVPTNARRFKLSPARRYRRRAASRLVKNLDESGCLLSF